MVCAIVTRTGQVVCCGVVVGELGTKFKAIAWCLKNGYTPVVDGKVQRY